MKKLLFLFAGGLLFTGANAQGFEDFNEWFTDGEYSSTFTTMSDGSAVINVTDACDPWSVNFSNIFNGVSGQNEGNTFTLSFDVMWNGEAEATTFYILTGKLNSFVEGERIHDDYQWVSYGNGGDDPIDEDGNTELLYYDEYGELQYFGDEHNKAFAINEGEWTHVEWGGVIGKKGANYIGIQINLGNNDGNTIGDFYFKNIEAQFGTNTLSYFKGIINAVTADLKYEIANGEATVAGTNLADDQTSVIIPETVTIDGNEYPVTAIGNEAFQGCSNLTAITIPNSVKIIGGGAFTNCTNLESINIPASVETLGNNIFEECYNLAEITVDDGNAYYSAVDGVLFDKNQTVLVACPSGKTDSYTVPSTVTEISHYAFQNCFQLEEVILPDGLEGIGKGAFFNCDNLESIIIPESVTWIDYNAFDNCDNLTIYCETCTYPSSWNSNWNGSCDYQFAYGSWNLSDDGILTISKCVEFDDEDYYPWYSMRDEITSIVIEDGVTCIGNYAFYEQYNVETVTIPNTVTKVGYDAFDDCDNLTFNFDEDGGAYYLGDSENPYYCLVDYEYPKITVHNDCKVIANYALNGASMVNVPETVEYIGDDSFAYANSVFYTGSATGSPWGASNLNPIVDGDFVFADEEKTELVGYIGNDSEIEIPSTVVYIDYNAFAFSNITSVDMSNASNLTYIGQSAFYLCQNLTSVVFPDGLTTIDSYAFSTCQSLTSVTIPSSVTTIGNYAFQYCNNIESIDLSNATSLEYIGDYSFQNTKISELVIPSSVAYIGYYAFYGNEDQWQQLTTLDLSNATSLRTIGGYAFYGCKRLTSVDFSNTNLTSIGNYAFAYGSSLEQVTIPSSVTSIGNYAFGYCGKTLFLCEATSKPTNWNSSWNYDNSGRVIWHYKNIKIDVYSDDYEYGDVEGSGYYEYGEEVTLTAIPNEGYQFLRWSDGEINSTRTITVTEADYYYAYFAEESETVYTVTLNINNPDYGYVYGAGRYVEGDYVEIVAYPYEGCYFNNWSNGDESDYLSFEITEDVSLTANFGINTYDVEISTVGNGTITGSEGGTFNYGTELSYTAVPDEGYRFAYWSYTYNGYSGTTTANPFSMKLAYDYTLVANFAECPEVFVGENTVYANGSERNNCYFVPTETCLYAIYAVNNNYDTYGYILDADGNVLTEDDDNGYEYRQFLMTRTLTEGETYYIGAGFYSGSNSGNVNFIIEKRAPATITATAENGTVEGTGTYDFGTEVTVTAVPDEGYQFLRWSDGFSYYQRTFNLTEDVELEAIFCPASQNIYNVSILISGGYFNYVTGGGLYQEGETVTLTAVPYPYYHFVEWSDGVTDATRTFTASEDVVLTATFAADVFTVNVIVNNSDYGYVTGAGSYEAGSYVNLYAFSNDHCYLDGWEDGYTYNNRNFYIYKDTTFTVNFGIYYYDIDVYSYDESQGSVEGSGSYAYGSTATLTATSKTGYHFSQWSDGNTYNPREITVYDDDYYTAYFEINTYTVTIDPDLEYGSISQSGSGLYIHGTEATFTAIPATNYKFVRWNNLLTEDEFTVTMTQNMTLSAVFCESSKNIYEVTTKATNGSVKGASLYVEGEKATLTATPDAGYHFTKWSTDDTDNPLVKTINRDQTITAYFEINTYAVNVSAGDNGSVEVKKNGADLSSGATVEHGEEIIVKATAAAHYHFAGWSDGNKNAERTIKVTNAINLTANFEIDTYTIAIKAKNGSVEGNGTYEYGATATLTAKPRGGYHFVSWSDGNTDNPRTITVNGELFNTINESFTAIFEAGDATAVNEEEVAEVNIFAYSNTIVVENADSDILVYSAMGQLVNRTISNGLRDEITINGTGIYIVKVGNTAKRVSIRN